MSKQINKEPITDQEEIRRHLKEIQEALRFPFDGRTVYGSKGRTDSMASVIPVGDSEKGACVEVHYREGITPVAYVRRRVLTSELERRNLSYRERVDDDAVGTAKLTSSDYARLADNLAERAKRGGGNI